jgi:hypothetical protein
LGAAETGANKNPVLTAGFFGSAYDEDVIARVDLNSPGKELFSNGGRREGSSSWPQNDGHTRICQRVEIGKFSERVPGKECNLRKKAGLE